jgi:leucyl aminopeptidase
LVRAIGACRDLINTPAADLGPAELADAARAVARRFDARCTVITGATLKKQYPAVYTVGAGSHRAPRLIDLRWGAASAPKLTLVGKGVCFDSGGLDLKPAHAMKLMKKDMGGAATVLALAEALMDARLAVRLRVLIPAVENAISDRAMRPLDVIHTRSGKTVEVGNTDAEGRLILCDALAEAAREQPALIIDVATLTGAARVALGELPALFCNDDRLAEAIVRAGEVTFDPIHRLPLHRGYRRQLDSKVADLSNVSSSAWGGAISAALFLEQFVGRRIPWAHIDVMGWNHENQPGRPVGGEAHALRALYRLLIERFGTRTKTRTTKKRKAVRRTTRARASRGRAR